MAGKELYFGDEEFIVSKTDLKGRITYGNSLFVKMSGYTEQELLGAPHNILRHKSMPKLIFTLLWEHIENGKEIFAYVVNKTKDDDYYWVFANVTASFDANGKIVGYHSIRRKPTTDAMRVIEPLYKELLRIENSGGVNAAREYLDKLLQQKGLDYEQFILSF
jgi:PAS domain S-box-containing protein